MKIDLTEIYAKLEAWRDERGITAIREFRPVSFELANTLDKAKELMGLNDE